MKLQLPWKRKPEFGATVIHEKSWKQRYDERVKSSQASSTFDGRIMPPIPFKERNEFYATIGRLQNTVDSIVLDVINRDWFYDDEKEQFGPQIELMEQWEQNIQFTKWLGKLIRNWILNGVQIISKKDWVPIQMESLIALVRDDYGDNLFYVIMNARHMEVKLPAEDFIWIPYIEHDRQAWPTGMFESLMREYEDIDGFIAKPMFKLHRQANQDIMKIHHKYASPRVIYTFPGVDKQVIDDDIAPLIEAMKPGDRLALNVSTEGEIQLIQETVDGRARFSESIEHVVNEIDAGLQTSRNRLQTKPSAMADAREARSQDDDRVLGIMEMIREFMDTEIIPRITGLSPGNVMFKWGAKDRFDLVFPEPLKDAIQMRIITVDQARRLLEDQYRWKIPEPTELDNLQPPGLPTPPTFPVQATKSLTPGVPPTDVEITQLKELQDIKEKSDNQFIKTEIKKLIVELHGAQHRQK